ncbi:LacI family DNA-binding transcriptional regulator [Ruania rhizosphaerae]|uniref:LacI family DNA-binding transcriptional regulator n=1 Tax=Ruania rhizosphaerae TaxID=1840413 RepID=UPI001F482270|nr:LacI family DNA-binding transcriptional regulator [Ruania rhizosphaerae]
MTIYDVAERAAVSPATVSRVLNGKSVKAELAARVLEAADTLAYVPNRTARTLRRRHSEVIALIIPDVENPLFTALARGVEDVAREAGYSLVLCNSDDDLAKEREYLDIAISGDMAGVIIVPAAGESNVDLLLAKGRAVVAVDRPVAHGNVDTVVFDNARAGHDATTVLWEAGYRRIACITGPNDVRPAVDRAMGWQAAMLGFDSTFPAVTYLRHGDFRTRGGQEMMLDLLQMDEPPDAVVAANNLIGVGAINAMAQAGTLPPTTGIAVVGGLPYALPFGHPIPVVHLPTRHIGMSAARILLDRLSGSQSPVSTVVLRGELTPPTPA